jgi:virulence-associated protein VagC
VEQEGLPGASTSNFEDEVLDEDVGAAYCAVRARVQGIRIPSDLSLPESAKTGIRRSDQPLLNVIQRSAKYCKTALRVSKGASANREQTMSDLFKVLIAHVKFLQEEHAGLVVLETGAGRDKKVLLQSHADRQADRRFMTTSNEILMSLLSTETFNTEMLRTGFF